MAKEKFNDLLANGAVHRLAKRLADIGRRAYRREADGFYEIVVRPPERGESAPTLSDVYHSVATTGTHVPDDFEDLLHHSGFQSFRFLAAGTTTEVFTADHANGHSYAIRFDEKPVSEPRIVSPLVIQPFGTYDDADMHIEVLPMVQLLKINGSNLPRTQLPWSLPKADTPRMETVLRHFMLRSLKTSAYPLSDLGVLPDGTPIQLDPGQLRYADPDMGDKPAIIRQALQVLHDRNPDLPQPFRWFTGDKVPAWKQDKFFANPFKTTPYYRGFTPGS